MPSPTQVAAQQVGGRTEGWHSGAGMVTAELHLSSLPALRSLLSPVTYGLLAGSVRWRAGTHTCQGEQIVRDECSQKPPQWRSHQKQFCAKGSPFFISLGTQRGDSAQTPSLTLLTCPEKWPSTRTALQERFTRCLSISSCFRLHNSWEALQDHRDK